ncbi:MAG: hypothetical protein WA653_04160 [Candidatus Sulfotelmatobacter sp.]
MTPGGKFHGATFASFARREIPLVRGDQIKKLSECRQYENPTLAKSARVGHPALKWRLKPLFLFGCLIAALKALRHPKTADLTRR